MENKKILFLDKNTIQFFKSRVMPNLSKDSTLILTDDKNIKEDMKLQGFKVEYILDYSFDHSRKSGLDFLNSLQSKRIADNDLLGLFNVEGVSIWHMLLSYSHKATLRIITYFELMKEIAVKYEIEEALIFRCPKSYRIVGYSNDKFLSQKILQLVCQEENIKITTIEFNPYLLKEKIIFANLHLTLFIVLFRFVVNLFRRKAIEGLARAFGHNKVKIKGLDGRRKRILFVSASSYWRRGYSPFNNDFENIDTICYPIMYKLKDEFDVLGIESQYLDKKSMALKEKLQQQCTRWKSFEGYVNLFILLVSLRKYFQFLKKLKKHVKTIKTELFVYDSINFYDVFAAEIRSLIKNLFYDLLYIEIAKKIIEIENPVLCFLVYETGPFERAIIHICQKRSIPTIGLQHGVGSYDTNPDYIRNYDYNPAQALLPNYMFVYGETTKEVFCQGGYPAERVQIMGNQEYDFYGALSEKKEKIKTRLMEKFNIPKDKRIILFISTNSSEELTEANIIYHLENLYGYLSGLADYFLIVKLHPMERTTAFHRDILEDKGMQGRYLILKNEACVAELILCSDLAIMYGSTAGYEALMGQVPLLSINFTHYVGDISCIKKKVVPVAKDMNELDYYFKELISGSNSNQTSLNFLRTELANFPNFDTVDKIRDFVKKILEKEVV